MVPAGAFTSRSVSPPLTRSGRDDKVRISIGDRRDVCENASPPTMIDSSATRRTHIFIGDSSAGSQSMRHENLLALTDPSRLHCRAGMHSGVLSQTTAVRHGHEIDRDVLDRYLRERLHGYRGPLEIRQFEGGQSNPTYLLHTADRDYVLRKKPPGQLLPSAHQVDREYRVMTALGGSGIPVPRTQLLCDDASVIGTSFFVMDCVDGRVFRQPHLPGVSPEDRAAMYDD